MFESGSSGSKKSTKGGSRRGPSHLKGTRALERLRNRIELAVKELHRLREENHALRRELEAMQRGAGAEIEGTQVVFSESGDDLKQQLEAYIGVIDGLIEAENARIENEEAAQ